MTYVNTTNKASYFCATPLLRKAGENTFRKDKRINIRLTSHDLDGIQRKASRKGIPYQALISGLIHQYVEGDLMEASSTNPSRH